ncbi:hypothetical protein DCCM_0024 [Desulfocucumis palustris]|uniref:Uncharacterized protein n=1 Tax=Desulfocucumis palustris TaxID=1898651 RepID=A0A2L2X776_9FIRM|nr:hypothetical protein DCCM_0024 [Desulfocucumis palustris]
MDLFYIVIVFYVFQQFPSEQVFYFNGIKLIFIYPLFPPKKRNPFFVGFLNSFYSQSYN